MNSEWFAIYDEATGEVLRHGSSTDPRAAEVGLRIGEAVFRGQIDPASQMVRNGKAVKKKVEPLPAPTPDQIKEFAARLLRDTDWYVLRSLDPDGAPVPESVTAYRSAVRAASGEIEAMRPIPADYRDAKYWPDKL